MCLSSNTTWDRYATDGDVLAKYFDDAPRVSFPGRAFPVATLHLEDAIAVGGVGRELNATRLTHELERRLVSNS